MQGLEREPCKTQSQSYIPWFMDNYPVLLNGSGLEIQRLGLEFGARVEGSKQIIYDYNLFIVVYTYASDVPWFSGYFWSQRIAKVRSTCLIILDRLITNE